VRGAVTGVGEESGLLTGERMRTVPGGVNGHGEKAHGDALTGGHQHVHLALGRVGVDAQRLVDQVVGRVSHGGDDHGHPVALFLGLDDALGHALDRFGIGDRRAAVLLHDESHCCPIFSRNASASILRKRHDYRNFGTAAHACAAMRTGTAALRAQVSGR